MSSVFLASHHTEHLADADANANAQFGISGLALIQYDSENIQFAVRAFIYCIHASV
jgi:hypothetical protein